MLFDEMGGCCFAVNVTPLTHKLLLLYPRSARRKSDRLIGFFSRCQSSDVTVQQMGYGKIGLMASARLSQAVSFNVPN